MLCFHFWRHSSLPGAQESVSSQVPDRELVAVHLEAGVSNQAGLSGVEEEVVVEICSDPEGNLDLVGARSTPEAVRTGVQNCLVVDHSLDRIGLEEVEEDKSLHRLGEDSSGEGMGTRRDLKEDLVLAVLDPDERSSAVVLVSNPRPLEFVWFE